MRAFSKELYEESRQKILRAALEICAVEGFEGMTIEKLARRVGQTKPALYHYFKNKEDLLVHLTLRYLEQANREIAQILHHGEGNHSDRLRRLLEYYITQGREEPGYFYLEHHITNLLGILPPSPGKEEVQRLSAKIPRLIMQFIEEGIAEGSFTAMDPMTMGTLILSMLSGVLLHGGMPGIRRMPPEELSRMVSRIIMQGVQP